MSKRTKKVVSLLREFVLRDLGFGDRAMRAGYSQKEVDAMIKEANELKHKPRLVNIVDSEDMSQVVLCRTTLTNEEIKEAIWTEEYDELALDYEMRIEEHARRKNAFYEPVGMDRTLV